MRALIIGTILFLSACNGSNSDESYIQGQIDALKQANASMTKSLAAATHADAQKFSTLQLIGKAHSVMSAERAMAIGEIANAVDFGPCSNMGVMIGFENANGAPANALSAVSEDFKQCTGYMYGANVLDGSITVGQRIFWDGPNCTGNLLEWEAGGFGYSTTALQGGLVFASPVDSIIYMVKSGQTPQPILIQSVWVASNPGCQADIETQLMYSVIPNDKNISGVPSEGVGKFNLGSP